MEKIDIIAVMECMFKKSRGLEYEFSSIQWYKEIRNKINGYLEIQYDFGKITTF